MLIPARAAMKNADGMMMEIIKAVDTNGDGKIQYDGAHALGSHVPFLLAWWLEQWMLMLRRVPILR